MGQYDANFSELAKIFCLQGTIKNVDTIKNGYVNASYDVTMKNEA